MNRSLLLLNLFLSTVKLNCKSSAHKRNRRKPRTRDGRPLRHYKHRWSVERFFEWLHNYRKCVVRYERKADNFQGFLYLAAIIMLIKYF
ncbi:hypothetical protein DRJ53_20045 [Paracnuella aquatica]|nr:hypothetical protein DRJ53_20045 [Paracnuella aquatica]